MCVTLGSECSQANGQAMTGMLRNFKSRTATLTREGCAERLQFLGHSNPNTLHYLCRGLDPDCKAVRV